MKGYVKKRGDRYYAVIYEGRDPVTGKEHRSWHPAGTDRAVFVGIEVAACARSRLRERCLQLLRLRGLRRQDDVDAFGEGDAFLGCSRVEWRVTDVVGPLLDDG